jgi:hypothetical protein
MRLRLHANMPELGRRTRARRCAHKYAQLLRNAHTHRHPPHILQTQALPKHAHTCGYECNSAYLWTCLIYKNPEVGLQVPVNCNSKHKQTYPHAYYAPHTSDRCREHRIYTLHLRMQPYPTIRSHKYLHTGTHIRNRRSASHTLHARITPYLRKNSRPHATPLVHILENTKWIIFVARAYCILILDCMAEDDIFIKALSIKAIRSKNAQRLNKNTLLNNFVVKIAFGWS